MTIDVEIFSDVICPWCFIGKRRLDRALECELGTSVRLRWRPYQLRPQVPQEGLDRLAYLRQRYGTEADSARVPERIVNEANSEGLTLRYDLITKIPNTYLAHRLLELGHIQGCQHELAEALFQAYFCQGLDVGDSSVLTDIGQSLGLADVGDWLASEAGSDIVDAQLARAADIGLSGVPGYYLANGFLLPGAQTSDTMQQILRRVIDRMG